MTFQSTRETDASPIGFVEALHRGLAPDGGLYVPTSPLELPDGWADLSDFQDLAAHVLGRWLNGALPAPRLEAAVRDALSFPVQLVPLDGAWRGVHVLELFHGPTLSFKDFGARSMARLMAASLEPGSDTTILVATSGDTGSAVADGFSGIPGIRVVLLYPEGQVSPTQERQLIVERDGVRALRVRGTFDDCQRMVKGAFRNPALSGIRLSSANSINIGRLLPQALYYIWAVARLPGRKVRVCVPSGNLGNLTAAMLAHLGGLPVDRFLAAHNANRFFPGYLDGESEGFVPSVRTLSNAMDVGAPSNFERLEWLLGRRGMGALIDGASVTDGETIARMREVYETAGYIADPHTAVGLEAVRRAWPVGEGQPAVVVASTAHPAKFPEAVREAVGTDPAVPQRLSELWHRPVRVEGVDATDDALARVVLGATG